MYWWGICHYDKVIEKSNSRERRFGAIVSEISIQVLLAPLF